MTIIEMESALKLGNAVKPWNSVDAIAVVKSRVKERQELIDMCLECTAPKCWNCLAHAEIRNQVGKAGA